MNSKETDVDLLRHESAVLRKKCLELDALVRNAEKALKLLQEKVNEVTVSETSPAHVRNTDIDSDALRQYPTLRGECDDLQEFLQNYCTSDRISEALVVVADNKQALTAINQLRVHLSEEASRAKGLEAELSHSSQRLSEEISKNEALQRAMDVMKSQAQDLDDQVRQTRAQCETLKVQLQDERRQRTSVDRHAITQGVSAPMAQHQGSSSTITSPEVKNDIVEDACGNPASQVPRRCRGVCPQCAEMSYGLMVRCGDCGWPFHAACARKQRQDGGDQHNNGRFRCTECQVGK